MKPKTSSLLSISASLIFLTSSASAALVWTPDAGSPNGEFNSGTAMNSVISYGTLLLDDGVTLVDYAVKLNDASGLRVGGTVAPSNAANNMFAVHADGSADLYTAIDRGVNGFVDISVCTFGLGTYNAGTNVGTPTSVTFGVTAQNYSPNTVTGSDMVMGSDIQRLNNNEHLFSTSPITVVSSPALQIETNIPGDPTNLGNLNSGVPTGFSSAFAWEASTGTNYGANGTLESNEADFNVTYTSSPVLRLRRDDDRGINSAFGFAAAADPVVEEVPEPSRAVLLGIGLIGILLRRQR